MKQVGITVVDAKVRSLDLDFHELSWKIRTTIADIYDHTFTIHRSESPEGPWTRITEPFEDQYIFIDTQLQVAHRWRRYYYRIQVTRKSDEATADFGPFSNTPEPDLIAMEIRRHIHLLMQEFAGRRLWILPVRTFGQRCPTCWNPKLNKRRQSGCRDCFDTGFLGGYMHPIEAWAQIDPSTKSRQVLNVHKTQQSNTTMRMPNFPELKPDDLVIEAENRRWRVETVSQTEKHRAGLHQEIGMHELEPKDIEFSVPLLMDRALRDVYLSPARNFSNPHNFANFESDEVPSIFDLYSSWRSR